jgi:hypothetical protein
VSEALPLSEEAPAQAREAAMAPAGAEPALAAAPSAPSAIGGWQALAPPPPWQPCWRPGELSSARFLPMGLLLELITNSPRILAAAERCFGGYGRPEAARAVDLGLRLYEHAPEDLEAGERHGGRAGSDKGSAASASGTGRGRGPAAARAVRSRRADARQLAPQPVLRCEGPYLYQASSSGSVLVADRARGLAFGYVSPVTVADAPLVSSLYLEAALFYLLECRGFLGIHAAALARGGRGLLLRGASGQGKTTLAYAAARRGFQALSEDVVWVELERAVWWGAPWTFHLLPDARRLFPELAGRPLERQPNGEVKVVVELESVRPGSTAPSAQAGPVVMLSRRPGSPSRLAAIDPARAWREWLAGCAQREREVPGYEAAVAGLLRGGCFRLRLGDDLDAAIDLLEPLLP